MPPQSISGILDFGDMIHAPRILEPAVAMSEMLTEGLTSVASLSSLLEGYAQRQPLDGADVEVLYDLVTARHAVTILVHAWRGRHDPQGARMLDRATVQAARSFGCLARIRPRCVDRGTGIAPPARRRAARYSRRPRARSTSRAGIV